MHAAHLSGPEHPVRSGGRWLRQHHSVRLVSDGSDVRWLGGAWGVRHEAVRSEDLYADRRELRSRRRWVRWIAELRNLPASGIVRRWRHSERVRRHRVVARHRLSSGGRFALHEGTLAKSGLHGLGARPASGVACLHLQHRGTSRSVTRFTRASCADPRSGGHRPTENGSGRPPEARSILPGRWPPFRSRRHSSDLRSKRGARQRWAHRPPRSMTAPLDAVASGPLDGTDVRTDATVPRSTEQIELLNDPTSAHTE